MTQPPPQFGDVDQLFYASGKRPRRVCLDCETGWWIGEDATELECFLCHQEGLTQPGWELVKAQRRRAHLEATLGL